VFLGHGRRAFDDALEYVKERKQFGRPIGSFQAIKHRLDTPVAASAFSVRPSSSSAMLVASPRSACSP
jgi:hypothetical protein